MSAVTTHVLDTALGRPAAGVPVRLDLLDSTDGAAPLGSGRTDADGRVADLGPDLLEAGAYQLTFDTTTYFQATGQVEFYPRITVAFTICDPAQHHHVPVLLSPFAYSTYRGS